MDAARSAAGAVSAGARRGWRAWRRRATAVAGSAATSLLLPALSPLVSILVVRLASFEVWGAFVPALVVVQLAAHVIGWGNRDALLRDFSRDPAGIGRTWRGALLARALLLAPLPAILVTAGMPAARAAALTVWTAAFALQQAHDVLVAYRRAFAVQAAVELGGLAATAVVVVGMAGELSADLLIALFAAVAGLKAGVLLLCFGGTTLRPGAARPDLGFFARALPFFLLGLSGLVVSRADLYCVSLYLPRAEVGRYQVFVALVVMLETVPAMLLLPFLRGLYRLGGRALLGLVPRFALVAPAVVLPGTIVIAVLVAEAYRITLPVPALLAGGLAALPAWAYLPVVYELYRSGRQAGVLRVNVLGAVVNLALTLLLLPRLGMVGALAGAAAAQWSMLIAYLLIARRLAAAPPAAAAIAAPAATLLNERPGASECAP